MTEFEHIGDVAARLVANAKARIEQAIIDRDEHAGAEAHQELLDLEHHQRLLATVRKYSERQE